MTTQWTTRAINKSLMDLPFPEELMEEFVVILMQGKNSFGDKVYCYLEITIRKMKELRAKMVAGEGFSPSDFGTVVAAGRGEPTPEVKAELSLTYKIIDSPHSMPAAKPAEAPQQEQKAWDDY